MYQGNQASLLQYCPAWQVEVEVLGAQECIVALHCVALNLQIRLFQPMTPMMLCILDLKDGVSSFC